LRGTDAEPTFEEAQGTIGAVLHGLIDQSWDAWDTASSAGASAEGSMPILYFGDLLEYQNSTLRVVTVGLNPSGEEFPSGDRTARFSDAAGVSRSDPYRYYQALNLYFEQNPYRWFNDYEQVLGGLGVSYTTDAKSTALHTDICSPVATAPTWTGLDNHSKDRLLDDGVPLWHELIRFLCPDVIVMSVAKEHLNRVAFVSSSDAQPIHTITHNDDGAMRHQPYAVMARWHDIDGRPALLIHARAAQTPFGLVTHQDKHEIGQVAKTYYEETRPAPKVH